MKYLKPFFESLSNIDDMVLSAYKNSLKNKKMDLFRHVYTEYGLNHDVFKELCYYVFTELKDLKTFKMILNKFYDSDTQYVEDTYKGLLSNLFNNKKWYTNSFLTGELLIRIEKYTDYFMVYFYDESEDDDGTLEELSWGLSDGYGVEIDFGKNDEISSEDGFKLIMFLFSDKNKSILSIDGESVEGINKNEFFDLI